MTDSDQTASPPKPRGEEKAAVSTRPTSLGLYDRPQHEVITSVEIFAIVISVLWLLGSTIFFVVIVPETGSSDPSDKLRFMLTLMAIFLPVAMVWVAATAARASRIMREESKRLQTAIDGIRQAYLAQQQGAHMRTESSVAKKLDEIAATARKTETALAMFQSRRDEGGRPAPTPPAAQAEEQPALALGTTAADLAPELPIEDFIRALNFPETAEDETGFAALRRALKDRTTSQLVQAAQDVLTLLSQDGIYMDDLRPDRARPEIWREFAAGARGRPIAALGGIRDRSSLALTNARMKQDPIFRDAAHHFLRHFDKTFAVFEGRATDSEISAMADTRTARAFMLLGRCAGTFD
jgi:hypothetical protein